MRVLRGLRLGPGDEVLTAPDEHPGLLGPLATLCHRTRGDGPHRALRRAGRRRRAPDAPCRLLARELGDRRDPPRGPRRAGRRARAARRRAGRRRDRGGRGGAGLRLLRGRRPEVALRAGRDRPAVDRAGVARAPGAAGRDVRQPGRAVAAAWSRPLQPDARRHDAAALPAEASAAAVAAHEVLAAAGWDAVHERARSLAAGLAHRLRERGRAVAPRGDTTLVAWEDPDPPARRDRLAAAGVAVRDLPGTGSCARRWAPGTTRATSSACSPAWAERRAHRSADRDANMRSCRSRAARTSASGALWRSAA